jgi:pimeloyl-ACP methyl ester carboxylesterase
MRFRLAWKKLLLGCAVLFLLLVTVGLPYILARLVTSAGTRPQDLVLISSPLDYDIDFENVRFDASDGVALSGWYLGGGDANLSVACGHGLFRSRREVLDRAAFFRAQGFDTLLFDFRHHGESGGERVTLGYQERLDFEGAIDVLAARRPGNRILLYGVSMGAAAALLAASETPEVAAVIVDSPFSSLEHTVEHHVRLLFGLPRFPFASLLNFYLEMRGGFDKEAFDLEKAAERLGERPLLVMAGESDRRMPVELQRKLFEHSPSSASRFQAFAGATHGAAYRTDRVGYENAVRKFLVDAGLVQSEAVRPRSYEVDGGENSSLEPR